MGSSLRSWLVGTRNVYIGNATTVRDYRVQLRGSRSVFVFAIYLMILIAVAMMVYSSTANQRNLSISEAQFQLKTFFTTTMGLLGLAVSLVAPGLTATTVVAERQRQSLDLIFSAPVSPRYYLVGKMMSSFRYTWMILVLALPITAASVVLGGASWSDVLVAYALLSLQGIMLTAFALLMSTLAAKAVSAIIWSYAATFVYCVVTFSLAAAFLVTSMFMHHGSGNAGPWWCTFSPFSVMDAARTYTQIGTHEVPNWVFTLIVSLLISKICLLGAGTLLTPGGGKEIVGLRVHALIYIAAIFVLIGWVSYPTRSSTLMMLASGGMRGGTVPSIVSVSSGAGRIMAWCTAPFILFLPFISCFGFDRERRYWPNGVFSIKGLFNGTPSGGLPFLLATMAAVIFGFAAGTYFGNDAVLQTPYWHTAYYITCFWFCFWGVGRYFSSFFGGLKTGRGLMFAAFLFFVALPFPFLIAVAGTFEDRLSGGPWSLYILYPLITPVDTSTEMMLLQGTILLTLGLITAIAAERRVKKKIANSRNYDERPLQAA